MAHKRMFSKDITESDAFCDMPMSSQALYLHLCMNADDDGFINNAKRIQRGVGASADDLNLLIAKKFLILFESGVVVIKHWRINNTIRSDRKNDTKYGDEMSMLTIQENGAYTLAENRATLLEQPACADTECDREETERQKAYRESSLPYSFNYKIRNAFIGEPCPICGVPMKPIVDDDGIVTDFHKPSIQHNTPISKGGKHELGNISVICHSCNVSIGDEETGKLNSEQVIHVWDDICRADDRHLPGTCQSSDGIDIGIGIGKDTGENPPIIPPYEDGNQTAPSFAAECLKALNDVLGTAYTTMPGKCGRCLNDRSGSFTVEDVRKMVEDKRDEWRGTRFAKSLTPNTLFSPDHFEQYMFQSKGVKPSEDGFAKYR